MITTASPMIASVWISEKGYIYSRLTRYVSVERIKWDDNFTNLLF